jgi:hypothetical protein
VVLRLGLGTTDGQYVQQHRLDMAGLAGVARTGRSGMFASILQPSILEASFLALLSLKEVRINGLAVEHYKKRQARYEESFVSRQ